jgi:hypothetical protein
MIKCAESGICSSPATSTVADTGARMSDSAVVSSKVMLHLIIMLLSIAINNARNETTPTRDKMAKLISQYPGWPETTIHHSFPQHVHHTTIYQDGHFTLTPLKHNNIYLIHQATNRNRASPHLLWHPFFLGGGPNLGDDVVLRFRTDLCARAFIAHCPPFLLYHASPSRQFVGVGSCAI